MNCPKCGRSLRDVRCSCGFSIKKDTLIMAGQEPDRFLLPLKKFILEKEVKPLSKDELRAETKRQADMAAANDVMEMIWKIGTPRYTPSSRDRIRAARDAFNKLTYNQKNLVYNHSKLSAAESAYESLRLAAERAEAERLAAEKAEAERLAAERAEAERLTAERAEAERLTAERAEAERLTAERAEAERLAAERAEAERLAAERAEAERLAAERAEAERRAAERAEADPFDEIFQIFKSDPQANQTQNASLSSTGAARHETEKTAEFKTGSEFFWPPFVIYIILALLFLSFLIYHLVTGKCASDWLSSQQEVFTWIFTFVMMIDAWCTGRSFAEGLGFNSFLSVLSGILSGFAVFAIVIMAVTDNSFQTAFLALSIVHSVGMGIYTSWENEDTIPLVWAFGIVHVILGIFFVSYVVIHLIRFFAA